jgi:hypothetical protein
MHVYTVICTGSTAKTVWFFDFKAGMWYLISYTMYFNSYMLDFILEGHFQKSKTYFFALWTIN